MKKPPVLEILISQETLVSLLHLEVITLVLVAEHLEEQRVVLLVDAISLLERNQDTYLLLVILIYSLESVLVMNSHLVPVILLSVVMLMCRMQLAIIN